MLGATMLGATMLGACVLLTARRALAHASDVGQPPEVLLRTFSADPVALGPAAIALVITGIGVARLRRA
ncbi:MAG: hypothetical protein M3Y87_06460, partial [Myxococcota bacterium]|nr:hypothetical protein [Myxococcota bacterium]